MVEHILKDELNKKHTQLKFLFVGTFNPDIESNNVEPKYFYSRNSFWCILPHALGEQCLVDKGKKEWGDFCDIHNIGLIDLIESLKDADKNTDFESEKYSDKKLESLGPLFITTRIKEIINTNSETLRGVFFTRSTVTGEIGKQWKEIEKHCKTFNPKIYTQPLLTPSLRKTTIKKAIANWKEAITSSMPSAS